MRGHYCQASSRGDFAGSAKAAGTTRSRPRGGMQFPTGSVWTYSTVTGCGLAADSDTVNSKVCRQCECVSSRLWELCPSLCFGGVQVALTGG